MLRTRPLFNCCTNFGTVYCLRARAKRVWSFNMIEISWAGCRLSEAA